MATTFVVADSHCFYLGTIPVTTTSIIAPALRREPSNICQFATQLAQTQAIVASGGETGIIFLGDSITQGWSWIGDTWARTWAPRKSLNYGIGGDQTGHLLLRLQSGLLDGLQPSAVVQLIGVNNCWGRPDPLEVVGGIDACLAAIRVVQPRVRVLSVGILPCDQGCAYVDPIVRSINDQLPAIAARHQADFRDVGQIFRETDSSVKAGITTDGCHLSPAGYQLLSAGILAWLEAG